MESQMKAIIVDDEELARQSLKNALESFPDICIVEECANGFEAVQAVQRVKPDILFLDIQMPKLDGFDVVELLGKDTPSVVFVTSYDEYALRAFETEAIDYVLKPVKQDRLQKTIERLREQFKRNHPPEFESLIDKHRTNLAPVNRVLIRNAIDVVILPVDDIIYFEAEDDYVRVHTLGGKSYLKTDRMANLEQLLDRRNFCRIHRSYLLNISYLMKIEPYNKDSRLAILKTGQRLPISRAGYNILIELL